MGDEVLNVDRKEHTRAHTYLYAVGGAAAGWQAGQGLCRVAPLQKCTEANHCNNQQHDRMMLPWQRQTKACRVGVHFASTA